MADPPRDPDTGDDTGLRPITDRPPTAPRWVKVLGIIALVLVLFFVLRLLLGAGGGHGPGRHRGGGGATAPSSGQQNPGGVGGPADAVQVTTLDTTSFQPSSEFALPDAAMQQQHTTAMAYLPAGMADDTRNSVTLPLGVTKQLTWRLGDTTTFGYGCHQPGHTQAGCAARSWFADVGSHKVQPP
jgi:hypothetical protein